MFLQSFTKKVFFPLYVIVDEYDNFANQLITGRKDHLYRKLMTYEGFLRTFFKVLKEGRETGAVHNVSITGVLPITIDELASGFNIATFITLEPEFEKMLGFTQTQVNMLLDEIYTDHRFDAAIRSQTDALIKTNYDGYHFVKPDGEALYNSTSLIYFLNYFTKYGEYPECMTDLNLKTDLEWVMRITGSTPSNTKKFVEELLLKGAIGFDKIFLISKFSMFQLCLNAVFVRARLSNHNCLPNRMSQRNRGCRHENQ